MLVSYGVSMYWSRRGGGMLVSYGVSMYWSRRGGGMLVSYGVSMYWSRRGGGMLVSYGVSMYIVLSLWKTMVCICSRGINQSRNMDRNVATMVFGYY
jgi:hypothetical protein